MGKRSRAKKGRTPAPLTRPPLKSYMLTASTVLFVIAVLILMYGTAGMQYSRWNHTENAHVHPVFHPWAIVLGIVLLVVAIKKTPRS
jgi:uncharacterized membrane protein YidH (DUF202 family)